MPAAKQTEVPKSLAEFVQNIPDAQAIRARLEENRREKNFLRQLLKLSLQAKPEPKTTARG